MGLTGLERIVLELAYDGVVLEEPDSRAVAETYRRLSREGLLDADWWRDDALPLDVFITVAGRRLLRAQRHLSVDALWLVGQHAEHAFDLDVVCNRG